MRLRKAYIPARHLNSKRMGELAELGFMYRAASHGIGVAKPFGDSFPYDFLTQHGKRLLRVQVKSSFRSGSDRANGFTVNTHCKAGDGRYSLDDVDFIAAFIAKHDTWYLIPLQSVGKRNSIHLYPGKRRLKAGAGLFESYRELWSLLLDENQSKKLSRRKTLSEPMPSASEQTLPGHSLREPPVA